MILGAGCWVLGEIFELDEINECALGAELT